MLCILVLCDLPVLCPGSGVVVDVSIPFIASISLLHMYMYSQLKFTVSGQHACILTYMSAIIFIYENVNLAKYQRA